jgi:hypothetical protein
MKILRNIIAIALIAMCVAGCVSVKSVPYETTARAPKPDNFPIELYESKDIEKPYKVIGIVQADAGKRHSVAATLEKLRSAARRMGADALIDLSNQPIGGGVPSNGGTIYSGHVRDLWSAKAIVWKLSNKPDGGDGG